MESHISRKNIKTVTEINTEIQSLFDRRFFFVRVVGEVSNLKRPLSGHMYFNLKDAASQIRAVLFRSQSRYLGQEIKDGQQVVCDGRITVFSPRGDYQIIVDSIDFQGVGNLQLTFDRLKKKLATEGLFNPDDKKTIPDHPEKVVLITSPTGAAVHDFLSVCRKRNSDISIQIIPVRVQGEGSAAEIVGAITLADRMMPDIIAICRGGGSIEDLWSFNEEQVARAIFHARVPVITGIGHEIDFTIADFCADKRCATPTAVAELIAPPTAVSKTTVESLRQRLARTLYYRLESARVLIARAEQTFSWYDSTFYHKSLTLDNLSNRIINRFNLILERNHLRQHGP